MIITSSGENFSANWCELVQQPIIQTSEQTIYREGSSAGINTGHKH